ncbi:hypothetical protein ACWF94_09665 [Streptomyces sp. NPDC055078]
MSFLSSFGDSTDLSVGRRRRATGVRSGVREGESAHGCEPPRVSGILRGVLVDFDRDGVAHHLLTSG